MNASVATAAPAIPRVAEGGKRVESPGKGRQRLWLRIVKRAGIGTDLALVLIIFLAIFGGRLAAYDFDDQNFSRINKPPAWLDKGSWANPLGTDNLGRDLLSRIMVGAGISLSITGSAAAAACVLGVAIGLIAGYFRGWVDEVLMRIAETQLAFPYLLLGIAIMSIVQPSIPALIAVLIVRSWVVYAKVVRAMARSLRTREFVEAARALGTGHTRIVVRHILPNLVSSVLVLTSFQLAELLIIESSLSFLGLGVPPPWPSWGNMLRDGRDYLATAWWVGTLPGLAVVLTVLGDAMRDVLDPRLQQEV